MNFLGSKTLETKRLILHKTEERDLKNIGKQLKKVYLEVLKK